MYIIFNMSGSVREVITDIDDYAKAHGYTIEEGSDFGCGTLYQGMNRPAAGYSHVFGGVDSYKGK